MNNASKALLFARLRANFIDKKSFSTSSVRRVGAPHGSAPYRLDVPPCDYGPKIRVRTAFQAYIWFHVFSNFWYYPEIVLGHPLYEVPDVNLWTDEDLGIPPDDYDEEVEAGKAYYIQA